MNFRFQPVDQDLPGVSIEAENFEQALIIANSKLEDPGSVIMPCSEEDATIHCYVMTQVSPTRYSVSGGYELRLVKAETNAVN